jgi:hypothetical protein
VLRPDDVYCHETLNENIFLHIEDGNFNGWIASTVKILEVRLGENKVIISKRHRQDVFDDYVTRDLKLKEAWELQFPIHSKQDVYERIYVKYADGENGEINTMIGTLEKYYVYYSGFKNTDFKDLVVMENFYSDPDAIRHFALNNLEYIDRPSHRGNSTEPWTLQGTQEKFENILDKKIKNWYDPGYRNGQFQYIIGSDPIVHHVDENSYAGIVYLTPDAPVETGTSFFKSRLTNRGWYNHAKWDREEYNEVFEKNFYNRHMFEEIDRVGNVYNRLVLWDSFKIHAATQHFGNTPEDSRFFHIFFFDIED